MKIHITLIGKALLPAYYPIKVYDQEVIHVIGTAENEKLYPQFEKVLKAEGRKCFFHSVEAFDMLPTVNVCENIHRLANWDDEFLYNITGGTKVMAVAAQSVAAKYHTKVIYTTGSMQLDMNSFEKTSLNCMVSNDKIFALQGQELKSYEILSIANARKVDCAKRIKLFIEQYRKDYTALSRFYMQQKKNISDSFVVANLSYSKVGDRIILESRVGIILDISHPEAKVMLLEGRWWETLVANELFRWSNGKYEIWQNVIFKSKAVNGNTAMLDNEVVKNEIDILVNIGNVLLFVECKSGVVTQDTIYKAQTVRDVYGGDKSKAVIASYYPIKDELKEKASESEVLAFAPSKTWNQKLLLGNVASRFTEFVQTLNL